MLLRWSPFALPAVTVGLFAWGAAWFLWTGEGRTERERRAAAVLAVAGAALIADPGLVLLADTARNAHAAAYAHVMFLVMLPFLQLRLVASFPGKATLPLHVPALVFAGLVLTMLGLILGAARPEWALDGILRRPDPGAWHAVLGLIGKLALAAWLVSLAYGAFVTALAATAPEATGKERQRRRPWMTAYVGLSIAAAVHVFLDLSTADSMTAAASPWWMGVVAVSAAAPLAVFGAFALQGAARVRPTGGVRTRRFVSGSAVVALFTFPIVVGGELLERVIDVPGAVAGIMVALVLAIVLRPIQHMADRFARSLVKDENRTPGAAEMYRSAIEGAFGDGDINEKERRTLRRFSTELGLSVEEADRIEAEVLGQSRT